MKKLIVIWMLILTFVTVSVAQDPGWPRKKSSPAGKLVYYQPQVDSWSNHQDLEFRMAFSLTPTGGKQAVGVMNVHGKTDVNVDARTVLLSNLAITGTHFPSLDAPTADQMDQLVRTFLPPNASVVISLDRLIASVDKSQQAAPTVPVRRPVTKQAPALAKPSVARKTVVVNRSAPQRSGKVNASSKRPVAGTQPAKTSPSRSTDPAAVPRAEQPSAPPAANDGPHVPSVPSVPVPNVPPLPPLPTGQLPQLPQVPQVPQVQTPQLQVPGVPVPDVPELPDLPGDLLP